MKRPSKKEIKAAVDKLKESKSGSGSLEQPVPRLEAKKSNKNRIRKQGV